MKPDEHGGSEFCNWTYSTTSNERALILGKCPCLASLCCITEAVTNSAFCVACAGLSLNHTNIQKALVML